MVFNSTAAVTVVLILVLWRGVDLVSTFFSSGFVDSLLRPVSWSILLTAALDRLKLFVRRFRSWCQLRFDSRCGSERSRVQSDGPLFVDVLFVAVIFDDTAGFVIAPFLRSRRKFGLFRILGLLVVIHRSFVDCCWERRHVTFFG